MNLKMGCEACKESITAFSSRSRGIRIYPCSSVTKNYFFPNLNEDWCMLNYNKDVSIRIV
jgi:hypothetical protein